MRRAIVLVASCLLACESSEPELQGGEESSSTGHAEATTETTSSGTQWGSSTDDGGSSSTGGPPEAPPSESDFEWDAVEPFDCGERGHVIHESGPPANRVNFVILGDGYTADEIGDTYVAHVDAFLQVMFGPHGFPYDTYVNSINICRIDVVSAESGIDFPAQGVEVETALDGQGDTTTRLASVNPFKLDAELADALAGTGVDPDWVAVTLNTTAWVGAGGYPMLWSGGHALSPEIGVHEAGHTFHGLADEYGDDGTRSYRGGEPGEINVTADPRSEKWEAWLGFEQDGIGTIDLYEGARYFDFGMWRPSIDGLMRNVIRPHNAPSIDKMIRDIYTIARPIDDFSPKVADAHPPALGLRLIDETLVVVDWEVDGEIVLPDAGPRIWTAELALTPGAHAVRAVVRDPTQWVRADDRSMLEMGVTWPVEVPDSGRPTLELAPSLRPPAAQRRLVVRPRAPATSHAPGRPHALDDRRVRTMAANQALLRVRDDIASGRLEKASERLQAHARNFADLHASDRAILEAALACRQQGSTAAGSALPSRHARHRFAKLLRRACTRD
jgi:hypothetical protein